MFRGNLVILTGFLEKFWNGIHKCVPGLVGRDPVESVEVVSRLMPSPAANGAASTRAVLHGLMGAAASVLNGESIVPPPPPSSQPRFAGAVGRCFVCACRLVTWSPCF